MIVGLYNESDMYQKSKSADAFFRRLAESNGTPGQPFYMPNGTPFFCTAGGILLKRGLGDWDRLPESERKPGAVTVRLPERDPSRIKTNHRLTKPPPEALILRSYVRGLKLDKDGSLFAPKTIDWEYNIKLLAEPNRDFVWLRREERMALLPDRPVEGMRVEAPSAVRDRLCHWHIAGGYHGLAGFYTAEHFHSKSLVLTVNNVTAQLLTMRLEGAAVMKSGARYDFRGMLHYNRGTKKFDRFDIVAICDEGIDPKPTPQNVAPHRYYGIAFELAAEGANDLLPPFYLREHVGSPEVYFANQTR